MIARLWVRYHISQNFEWTNLEVNDSAKNKKWTKKEQKIPFFLIFIRFIDGHSEIVSTAWFFSKGFVSFIIDRIDGAGYRQKNDEGIL